MSIKISQQGFKIGSRILDENELKVLLPSYDNIFNQIDKFRDEASNLSKVLSNDLINFDEIFELKRDYNNIFSILGERGTGKTSAIATVRYRIFSCNRNEDIIMPLVVPDDMGETSDTLGWVITYIGEEVNKLTREYLDFIKRTQSKQIYTNKYTQLYDKNCRKNENINLNLIFDKVKRAYHFRKASYQKILEQEYVGKNEYANDNNEVLTVDQNLKKDFFVLIEEIIKVKKYLNDEKEPLIYFFFDDVDISAKRGPDVLNTIMRYLTHPNIVTFICGDYKVFSEMLTIDFLQNENLLDTELMEKIYTPYEENNIDNDISYIENTAINLRKIRGYDYLKKMLPSALRYEMPKLSNESKANFRYTKSNIDSDNNGTYKELTLIELIEKSIYTEEELNNSKSFLRYKKKIGYSYFLIFDSTPRGLINPYYFLYQMLQYKNEGYDWTNSSIKQFLDIIINSSLSLGSYKDVIDKIIRIYPKPEEEQYFIDGNKKIYNKIYYYIDYSYLESIFDETIDKKKGNIDKEYDIFISIFILAHFFENILVEINKKRGSESKNLHGSKLLCKILNSLNIDGNLYPEVNDVNRLLYIYYLLTKNISKINSIKVLKNKEEKYFVWKYFDKVLKQLALDEQKEINYKQDNKLLYSLFENIFKEDRKWVKKKIKQIFEFGMTDKKIFLDIKMELENKILNLGLNKEYILNSNELYNFSKSLSNDKVNIDYTTKLDEIINNIRTKNNLELETSLPYEKIIENLKEIFTILQFKEKLEEKKEKLKKELNECKKNISEIEDKFGESIFNIIRNIDNIDKEIENYESLLGKYSVKNRFYDFKNKEFIITENMNNVDKYNNYIYKNIDKNIVKYKNLLSTSSIKENVNDFKNEKIKTLNFEEYQNYINSQSDINNKWECLAIFNPQDIANRYGVFIENNKFKNNLVYLKRKDFNNTKSIKIIENYIKREELKVLKNYIIPNLEENKNKYEMILDKKRKLEISIVKNKKKLDSNINEKEIINNLKEYIPLYKDNLNSEQVKNIIDDFNENIIKREIMKIFKYSIVKENNDKLEMVRKIITLYEDILDASYEKISDNIDESCILLTNSIKKELKYLNSSDIPIIIRRKLNDLLTEKSHYQQEIIDQIIFYAKDYIYENESIYKEFELKRPMLSEKTNIKIKKIINILRKVESIKKPINDFDRKIASNNIDFILEDYIEICTLYKIIIIDSNGSSKKLRQELYNLISSNIGSKASEFNSFKRYIYSLEGTRG